MSRSSSRRSIPDVGEPILLAGDELLLLSPNPANLLLEGQVSRVAAVLARLAPHLAPPVTEWRGGALPDDHRGTLIVEGVDALDARQQAELLGWLDDASGTIRVIATTSGGLFSLVERGIFSDTLYYRLNVVRIEVPA